MKKRLTRAMLAALLTVGCFTMHSHAEPDYTDTGYWAGKCADYQSLSEADVTACKAYVQYQISQNNTKLKEIEGRRSEISANIQKYAAEVSEYQAQADSKQAEINVIEGRIAEKQAEINATQQKIDGKELEIQAKQEEIDAKVKEIEDRQAEVDAIREKLRERMVSTQPFMRVNRYLDILMGAESFSQLLRMTEGMLAISEYDKHIMDELRALIELLNKAKAELEAAKKELEKVKAELEEVRSQLEAQQDELEVQKGELVAEKGELLNLKYQAQVIEEEYRKQKAELEAQGNRYASNISGLNNLMKEIAKAGGMDAITSSGGWVFPVPGSRRSAGTWYYPGGGVHLGYDFAAPVGTNIYAVGNGIVINRADGCPYGYLGSSCGSQYGGSSGGGNQVYLLTTVNGSLYAVKYLHMLAGTPIRNGTIVSGGDIVGRVGSSGNSSGPHCHIEIFYLGSASNFSNYAQTWNGDLAFGCGWGYNALSRRCESGVGAPCRIRPESVFN
ncbi:MAG: peptidoglycan DD-metalloendopeptidase family protein [Solobacterium sp.]|nr:peptidoglycan DD-metalloendopeptidase family protein [Solobacterium sp.]